MAKDLNYYNSKYLKISAHDRSLDSAATNDFIVRFENNQLSSVKAVVIKAINLPNTFYNINQYNNRLCFSITSEAADRFIDIPIGQYNITELCASMQTALNNVVLLNSTTVTYETSPKYQIIFNFPEEVNFIKTTSTNQVNTLYEYLGFRGIISGNIISTGSQIISTHPPSLQGDSSVYIHSRALANNRGMDGDSKSNINLIGKVDLNNAFGDTCYYNSMSESIDSILYNTPRDLSVIDIRLRDSKGNKADNLGFDWSILLKLYTTK
jgi:hypothetical protein